MPRSAAIVGAAAAAPLAPPPLRGACAGAPRLEQRSRGSSVRSSLAHGLTAGCLALAGLRVRPGRRRSLVVRRVGKRGKFLRPETGVSTPVEEYEPRIPPGGTTPFPSIARLAEHYDAFTLDQYGVLHDGKSAYPGAADCLAQLHAAGKRIVILSNYAGRAEAQRCRLPGIGISTKHIDGVVTSGEITYQYLSRYREKLGSRVLWIAWEDLKQRGLSDYFSGLEGYTLVSDAREADFILVSGVGSMFAGTPKARKMSFEKDGNSVPFEQTFRMAIHSGKPMICANPDHRVKRPGGWEAHLPGELATHFERLGGRVIYFGKPSTSSFEEARRIFDEHHAGGRICHVGDSLRHDVSGATSAGFDAAFVVETGIHANDLPADPSIDDVYELCRKEETPMPAAVVPRFTW